MLVWIFMLYRKYAIFSLSSKFYCSKIAKFSHFILAKTAKFSKFDVFDCNKPSNFFSISLPPPPNMAKALCICGFSEVEVPRFTSTSLPPFHTKQLVLLSKSIFLGIKKITSSKVKQVVLFLKMLFLHAEDLAFKH